jgi:hypothetical protein
MKQFIAHIEKSIFGPDYYEELLTRPASFSWKYYWSFTMLLAVFMTIVTSLPLIPQVNRVVREIPPAVLAYFPDDLDIAVTQGHVSSNVVEPYFLPIPERWKGAFASATPALHLGVIDTKSPVSLDQFRTYSSLFWVAEDVVVSQDSRGGVRMTPLDASMTFRVNEQGIKNGIRAVEPFFAFVTPILVLMIFLAFVFGFLVNLFFLVFISLFILLLGMLLKRTWTYGTAYRIALHAVTLPLLVEQIFFLLPYPGFQLRFFTTIMTLVVVYMNFRPRSELMPQAVLADGPSSEVSPVAASPAPEPSAERGGKEEGK